VDLSPHLDKSPIQVRATLPCTHQLLPSSSVAHAYVSALPRSRVFVGAVVCVQADLCVCMRWLGMMTHLS